MRRQYRAFVAAVLVASGLYGAAAFNAADLSTRTVSASVVGDSAAYVAVAVNGSSPHAGFVTTSSGKIVIAFGSGVATGTGINAEASYYFDNLLNLTNQGTTTANIQVNSSSTSGTVKACVVTPGTTMTNGCYLTAAPASPQSLAVGSKLSIGVMVQANGLVSGNTVSGTISIVATR